MAATLQVPRSGKRTKAVGKLRRRKGKSKRGKGTGRFIRNKRKKGKGLWVWVCFGTKNNDDKKGEHRKGG